MNKEKQILEKKYNTAIKLYYHHKKKADKYAKISDKLARQHFEE